MSAGILTNRQRGRAYHSALLAWIDRASQRLEDFVGFADFPLGGSIGPAPSTVDIAGLAIVNQTTAGQTLTIPSPTETIAGQRFAVSNIGNQSFTIIGVVVAAGKTLELVWTGGAWSTVI